MDLSNEIKLKGPLALARGPFEELTFRELEPGSSAALTIHLSLFRRLENMTSRVLSFLRAVAPTLAVGGLAVVLSIALAVKVVPRLLAGHREDHTRPVTVFNWRRYADGGQRLRDASAARPEVTVTEFSDFQCPFCAVLAGNLHILQDRYAGKLAIVYRYFPLHTIHPQAGPAAVAARCAAEQNLFEDMHDVMFDAQSAVSSGAWQLLASEAGIRDSASFGQCIKSARARGRVTRDIALGRELDIRGTPTVLVNGVMMRDAPNMATLDSLIRDQLLQHRTADVSR